MNKAIEFVARSLLVGAGATIAMDVWAAVLRLITHTIFGVGLFLAARATALFIPIK